MRTIAQEFYQWLPYFVQIHREIYQCILWRTGSVVHCFRRNRLFGEQVACFLADFFQPVCIQLFELLYRKQPQQCLFHRQRQIRRCLCFRNRT